MSIVGRLRVAEPDRAGSAFGYDWVDRTADMAQDTVVIRAGTADEAAETQPRTTSLLLHNGADRNYRYTPGHPLSDQPWFDEGVAVEYAVQTGDPYLWATGNVGSALRTADHASLRVTGDHWGAVQVRAPLQFRYPANVALFGRADLPNNWSYLFCLGSRGFPFLLWTTGGSVATVALAASTVTCPSPAAGSYTVGWHIDVDNGASGHEVTFYAMRGTIAELRAAITAGDPAVQLGDVVVGSGTTSIFAGTAPLWLGDAFDLTDAEELFGEAIVPYAGRIEGAELRSTDHTGTILANPPIPDQPAGTTAFNDTAATPKAWTVIGDAYIDDHQTRLLGEVTSLEPHAPGHGVAGTQMAQVQVQGVMSRNRQYEKAADSVLRRVEKAQDPDVFLALWPMEDGSGSTRFSNAAPVGHPMGFGGEVAFASDDSNPATAPAPHVDAGAGFGYQGRIHPRPGIDNYRVTMFFHIPTLLTNGNQELLTLGTSGTVASWTFFLDDNGLLFQGFNSIRTLLVNPGSTVASDWDDGWVQLTLGVEQDGGNIDWAVAWLAATGNVYGFAGTVAGTIGVPTDVRGLFTIDGDGISFTHCSVTTDLGAGWLGWTEGARLAYVGETDATRVQRLATERGELVAAHTINQAAPAATLGPQRPGKVPDLLTETVAAGLGILSDHPVEMGQHYRAHSSLYNQQPRLMIDGIDVQPFRPTKDPRARVNHVTVTRTDGGSAGPYENAASINTVGLRDTAPTLNLETDNQTDEVASWLLHVGTWPEMRFAGLTVDLVKDPDLIPDWLATAIGDVVGMDTVPAWVGQPQLRQILRGYTETIRHGTPGSWNVALNATPAGPYTVGVLEDTVTRLATDASELDAGVDDNDLTGSVAVTDGPLWITTAGQPTEFPLVVTIDHEDLEVSGISGASSPQTFTWTRGANGTTPAAHSAGAAVQVRYPIRLAQ